ncbi:hypothetical protein Pan44_25680 [Caulifigura coniformis]|uniref:SD-repeat containing protein B domain-containing protein n=1 Tax=Caulifigura coniformis TaxID=2527983 RepID=A0A517SEI5_9PLAN|nr:SdrD B-like domain-containing protein [Caulifigura coniformis]QDT54535.1 hypothetical protein Pan44_25680 [Caulifigura coniformis]
MTAAFVQIRKMLRQALGRRCAPRRRLPGGASQIQSLESRQLLSAKRSYDQLREAGHATDHAVDHRLHVDGLPLSTAAAPGASSPQGIAPFALSQTFQLSSRPSATRTIYLDFNGHTTSGTWWNTNFNDGAAFTTPAFSVDGTPSFSDAELERIQLIWERVAEDFAPFDVNVTTQDPGTAAIVKSGAGDSAWGVRVVVGGSYGDWFGESSGGVAYLNTFGSSIDMGVFVFSNNLSNGEKNVAEAISHEVGHSLGLSHDGQGSTGYYAGHGSGSTGWAPIMGVGYYRELSQWSKGEYSRSTTRQDDLTIISSATNGFGYRVDDYGNNRAVASPLASTTSGGSKVVNAAGVIERNTDQDWFSFTTTGGVVSLDFAGAARGSNLDIAASLYNANGQLIVTSNPVDQTTASISRNLAAGTYYVMVDGVGVRGVNDGYSDYGSLGQYFITGTIPDNGAGGGGDDSGGDSGTPAGTSSITGRVWHDADGDGRVDVGDAGLPGVIVYLDANNNGLFESGSEQFVVTGIDGRYTFGGLAAGTYRIRQVPGAGYAQVYPRSNAARSVSLGTGRSVSNIDFRSLQPPAIGNLGATVAYAARSVAVPIASTGTVTDGDTVVFTGFKLTAQITSGGNSADRLTVQNQGRGAGQVGLSGSALYYSGVRVGTVSGGSGTGVLTITFNNSATSTAVQVVLRSISYRSTATSPLPGLKTVRFLMTEPNRTASVPATKQIQI